MFIFLFLCLGEASQVCEEEARVRVQVTAERTGLVNELHFVNIFIVSSFYVAYITMLLFIFSCILCGVVALWL